MTIGKRQRTAWNPLRLMALPADCANPEDIEWDEPAARAAIMAKIAAEKDHKTEVTTA